MKKPDFLTVEKPWGRFVQFTKEEKTTVKIIEIKKTQMLSLQSHKFRDELWVALDNGIIAEVDGKKRELKKGETIFVARNKKHRLSSKNGARVLEISFGKFDEKDITRFEDKYGRKGTNSIY